MGILEKIKKTFFTPRYLKFFVTGLTAFLTDFLIFRAGIRAGLPTLLANTISVGIAIIVNYTINRLWVFESKEKKVALEFGKFLLVQVINYVMNTGLLLLFVAVKVNDVLFGVLDSVIPTLSEKLTFIMGEEGNQLLAKFAATSIQLVTSFLLYKFIVFKKK